MINKKYAQPLFMILMSLGMSVIMSGVVVAVNTGISDGFFFRWGYSLIGLAFIIVGVLMVNLLGNS